MKKLRHNKIIKLSKKIWVNHITVFVRTLREDDKNIEACASGTNKNGQWESFSILMKDEKKAKRALKAALRAAR